MNICLIFANKDCLPCRKTSSHIYCLHVRVHIGMNTCAYMQMHMDMCVCVEGTGWQWVCIGHSLFFFLSQDLSLNLELAKSARLPCSQAQGTCCLWFPSTGIIGICCRTHFFSMYVPRDGTLALMLMHHVACDWAVSVPGTLFFNEDNPHVLVYIVSYSSACGMELMYLCFFISTFFFSLTPSFLSCSQAFEAPVPPFSCLIYCST